MSLTPNESPPIYLQIAEKIQQDIHEGALSAGSRLPPERKLATQLGVSIGTLRKSLAWLADRGWLQRRQGSGNYINTRPDPENRFTFFRLERIETVGTPTARTIALDLIQNPTDVPYFDGVARAHRLRRLRLLDDVPAVIEEIWLDATRLPEFDPDAFDGALYHYYQSTYGLRISRAEDSVSLATPPSWSAAHFPLSSDQNCGYVERRAWSKDPTPVEFSRSWFDTKVARYVVRQQ